MYAAESDLARKTVQGHQLCNAVNKQIIRRKFSANKQNFPRKVLWASTASNYKLINQLVDSGSYGLFRNYRAERFQCT